MSYNLLPIYRPATANSYRYDDRVFPKLPKHTFAHYADLNEFTREKKITMDDIRGFGNIGGTGYLYKKYSPIIDLELARKQQIYDDEEAEQQYEDGRPAVSTAVEANPNNTVFDFNLQDPETVQAFREELQSKKSAIISMKIPEAIKQQLLSDAYKQTFTKYFMSNVVQSVDPLTGKPVNNRTAQIQASNPFASGELPVGLDVNDYNTYVENRVDQKEHIQDLMGFGENDVKYEYKQVPPDNYPLEEFENPVLSKREQERYIRWLQKQDKRHSEQETFSQRLDAERQKYRTLQQKRNAFTKMLQQRTKGNVFKTLKELFEKKKNP